MSEARELHRKAMSLLDEANKVRMRGETTVAHQFQYAAYQKEREAACLLATGWDLEPTRSLLYKGAAVLALECGLAQEAQQLAQSGLEGKPPGYVVEQLENVLAKVRLVETIESPAEGSATTAFAPVAGN